MAENENIAARYRIDARQSQFVVQAFAHGLLSAFGHNPTIAICGFGGDVGIDGGALEAASILMLVQSDSLSVIGEVKEKDRREIEQMMRADVLETARYPEIVFMSTRVEAQQISDGQYQARIGGKLSLHGVTRDHSVEARVAISNESLRVQGECSLRQSYYNIKPVSALGGTLKVKDELKFSFDIVASKQ